MNPFIHGVQAISMEMNRVNLKFGKLSEMIYLVAHQVLERHAHEN